MSGKQARQSRAQAKATTPPPASEHGWRGALSTPWKAGAVVAAVAAIVAASFVLPGAFGKSDSASSHPMGVEHGAGLPVGSAVPSFSGRDLVGGQEISSTSLAGGKTLLFFSEGVMCQACFEQIKGIEGVGDQLRARGISLVSITPDTPGDLRTVVARFGIRTPVIADTDRAISEAFNTLGKGMHDDTPGHAFVLIDHGKVLWYRDYWLAPYRTMYVKPAELLAAIPA